MNSSNITENEKTKKFIIEMIDKRFVETSILLLMFLTGIHLEFILEFAKKHIHRTIYDLGVLSPIISEYRLVMFIDSIMDGLLIFAWAPIPAIIIFLYMCAIFLFNFNCERYYICFRIIKGFLILWLFGIVLINIFQIIFGIGQLFWDESYFLTISTFTTFDVVFIILISCISCIISFKLFFLIHKTFDIDFLEKYFRVDLSEII